MTKLLTDEEIFKEAVLPKLGTQDYYRDRTLTEITQALRLCKDPELKILLMQLKRSAMLYMNKVEQKQCIQKMKEKQNLKEDLKSRKNMLRRVIASIKPSTKE